MVEGVNMTVPMGKMRVWNVVSRIQKSYIFPNLVYFPVAILVITTYAITLCII